jgi:hypothetical protein
MKFYEFQVNDKLKTCRDDFDRIKLDLDEFSMKPCNNDEVLYILEVNITKSGDKKKTIKYMC